jgi:hypothetical protein
MRDPTDPWVVWSFEHQAWWGPGHFGYVTDLALAGRYTEGDARNIETQANAYRLHRHEHAMRLEEAELYGPPHG